MNDKNTYHQRNRERLLEQAKQYYKNNKKRLKEQKASMENCLGKKKIKKENNEKITQRLKEYQKAKQS